MNKNLVFQIEKYDALIFDFDGVIIDSSDIKNNCFKKLFEKHGIEHKVDVTEGGKSRYEKIRYFYKTMLDVNLSDEEVNEIAKKYSGLLKKQIFDCPWIEGAKDFIIKYSKKKDLFIVSGTPYEELIEIVRKRGIEKFFKKIYDSSIPKKERLIAISKNYNKTIFFGDQLSDYNAAKSANIEFIGVIKSENPFPKNIKIIKNFKN